MTGPATIAAVLLAVVFGVAAASKVARRGPTVAAFAALGVPVPALAAVAVPMAEGLIAGLLVVRPDIGGAAALAALAGFTLVVVRALSRGSSAGCACFGARRAEPVSPGDVMRNGCLAALAALATATDRLVRPGAAAALAMTVAVGVGMAGLAAVRRVLARTPATAGRSDAVPPAAARPADPVGPARPEDGGVDHAESDDHGGRRTRGRQRA